MSINQKLAPKLANLIIYPRYSKVQYEEITFEFSNVDGANGISDSDDESVSNDGDKSMNNDSQEANEDETPFYNEFGLNMNVCS